jgi:hypothetical protein
MEFLGDNLLVSRYTNIEPSLVKILYIFFRDSKFVDLGFEMLEPI